MLSLDQSVNFLRAAGESTRLRLLSLLSETDLTVSDLIEILGQSQPRISRHLKLLKSIKEQALVWFNQLFPNSTQATRISSVIENV